MKRDIISDTNQKKGKEVTLFGFVDARRDHGKIIFFNLRDASGIVQVVAVPKNDKAYSAATGIGSEDVVSVVGQVNDRPRENINPHLPTGEIEIQAKEIIILSKAKPPPIPIEGDGYDVEETVRFKNRHLDLRRERLQKNLKLRSKTAKIVRDYLNSQGFFEIETPYLSKTTPEGARDFLVPSRIQKGKFYALAQSPQQYKQLLMIAGIERYYQLARAFRDEDLRSDRQFEHTQIDLEMAFVDREDIMSLTEVMVTTVVEKIGKKIAKTPFPVIDYKQALKKYGSDRPNLSADSEELSMVWVVDFPLLEKTDQGYTFSHNPFTAPHSGETEKLIAKKDLENIKSLQVDLVCNGEEIGSGSIRITNPNIQSKVFEIMGYSKEEIDEQFGHLLDAYKYGAPPHGGIALGFDRLVALLAGEDNIREVIAFPVSSGGQTSIIDAPSEIDEDTLKEFGLRLESTPRLAKKKGQ